MPTRAIYLDVLQPAMIRIGELWQQARITVAHEHLATAITKTVMASLAPAAWEPPPIDRRVVLACTPGELHAVGLRMLADFLEGDGWHVLELGASTPTVDLIAIVEADAPDVVGLSTSLTLQLADAADAIGLLHALDRPPFVIVGGRAYGGDPEVARQVGADAFGADAGETSRILRSRFRG